MKLFAQLGRTLCLTLVATQFSTGCDLKSISGVKERSDHSAFKHTAGEKLLHTEAFLWRELNDDEYFEAIAPLVGMIQGKNEIQFLPPGSETRKALQVMVDEIMAGLKKTQPKDYKNIPRVNVHVVMADDPNAFVTPISICTHVGLAAPHSKIEKSDRVKENQEMWKEKAVMLTPSGEVIPSWTRGNCIESKDPKFLENYVAWYNKTHEGSCQLTIEKSTESASTEQRGRVRLNDACSYPEILNEEGNEPTWIANVMAGAITVHSGLLRMMDEDEVRSVLAHELAHYIKIHPIIDPSNDYEYFYSHVETPHASKPEKNPKLQELGNLLKTWPVPHKHLYHVPGQKYPSELFKTMIVAGSNLANHPSCSEQENPGCFQHCKNFEEIINRSEFIDSAQNFPFRPLVASQRATFLEMEKSFELCLQNATSIEPEMIREIFNMDLRMAAMFDNINAETGVQSAFQSAIDKVMAYRANAEGPLRLAEKVKLGYYTIEQEADELSLEYLDIVGRDPRSAIWSQMTLFSFLDTFYKKIGKTLSPTVLDFDRCKSLMENEWRAEDGSYVFVPVGDYEDSHHSTCYRMYNMDRELQAHDYSTLETLQTFGLERAIVSSEQDNRIQDKSFASITKISEQELEDARVFSDAMEGSLFKYESHAVDHLAKVMKSCSFNHPR